MSDYDERQDDDSAEEEEGDEDEEAEEDEHNPSTSRTFRQIQRGQVVANARYRSDVDVNVSGAADIPPNLPQGLDSYYIESVGQRARNVDFCGSVSINVGGDAIKSASRNPKPLRSKATGSGAAAKATQPKKPLLAEKLSATRKSPVKTNARLQRQPQLETDGYSPIRKPQNRLIDEEGATEGGGMALILTIQKYHNELYTRRGVENDTTALKKSFRAFGMRIFYPKEEGALISKAEISEWLKEFREKFVKNDHHYCVIVVMGHGTANDTLLDSYEEEMNMQTEIFDQFDNIKFRAMVDKPKIFVMQCCRGNDQIPALVRTDSLTSEGSTSGSIGLPSVLTNRTLAGVSDSLVIWSTVKGTTAYRNVLTGSYFVQQFCKVLDSYAEGLRIRPASVTEFSELLRELKTISRSFAVSMVADYGEIPCSQPMQIVDTLFGKFYLKLNGQSGYITD